VTFAADAVVMEKVWECGLMWLRDAPVREWKVRIEEPFVTALHGVRRVALHIEARLRLIFRIEIHVGTGVQWHVC